MNERAKVKIEKFVEKLIETLGKNLKSCIVYGSVVKGNYKDGISDINMIVVVENIDFSHIEKIRTKLSKIAYRNMIKVFFFTEWFISSSSDVFPVEWKDIKENHIVVYGQDLTEKIDVKNEFLRIQLERESKLNYLSFQQGLIFGRDILFTLSTSIKNIKLILKDIDLLTEEKIEQPEYFIEIEMAERGIKKISKKQLEEIARKHLEFLTRVIKAIDKGGKR